MGSSKWPLAPPAFFFFPGCAQACLGVLVFNVGQFFFCSRQRGSAFITTWLWPPNFFIEAKCQRTAPMVLEISWIETIGHRYRLSKSDDNDLMTKTTTRIETEGSNFQRDDARSNTYDAIYFPWWLGVSDAVPRWPYGQSGKKERTSSLRLTHVSARRGEVPSTGAVNKKIISIIFVG